MKKSVLLISLLIAAAINVRAQSVRPSTINAAGGSVVIGGTTECDWSVGEMALVSTFSTSGIVVTQGVLQPDDNPALGTGNSVLLAQQLQVFPNPATSEVNLKYSSPADGTLTYRMMDIAGKLIAERTIKVSAGTTSEQINVSELACATYMLEVITNAGNASSESVSYKIQKLK